MSELPEEGELPTWQKRIAEGLVPRGAIPPMPNIAEKRPNRIFIRPTKRWFTRRTQWSFELRAANGEPIDPRETVFNRNSLIETLTGIFVDEPLELVIFDTDGRVFEKRVLR